MIPILTDRVTVLRLVAGSSDRYGNATPTVASELEVPARVIPTQGPQDLVDRQETGHGLLQVILPAGTDVLFTDEVSYLGERYRIADVPKRFTRQGREHHVELLVERFTR